MKTVAIVQARMGSTRLPNKVMRRICGTPLIGLLLRRLSGSRRIDQILVATSQGSGDELLAEYVSQLGYAVFRGSENDVLDRYYQAAKSVRADIVVRITGDCPLVDPRLVDEVVDLLERSHADFSANTIPPTFPDGLDVEAFTFHALECAWKRASLASEREHVTPFLMQSNEFSRVAVHNDCDWSRERWTVDEPEDFDVVEKVFEHFHPRCDFTWLDVLALRQERPEWFAENLRLARNEGAALSTGQKLWRRAKRVIPGGNMLLSKRPEMFLPGKWPAYFSRAKGCTVWDLDGREYIDFCLMGVGTNILGYGHPEVDDAVRRVVEQGNMSTLNCPEEVRLAERLVELHPWAAMVRLARSGGEANAIAVRIARAAAGRDKVAFCGYHGWHDWYLAANLGDDSNLAGHLLPGLEAKGVPKHLQGSALPFAYNRLDELESLVRQHDDIGVIKMEVMRNVEPAPGFLEGVRRIATEKNIVLIFDECTAGFRQTLGGLHKFYGIDPDLAVFGKALGNGYGITAVVGRREVMEHAQETFISSTFWTERIGPAAALKTLDVMARTRSYDQITAMGRHIADRWTTLAVSCGLPLEVSGLPALASFAIPGDHTMAYKTLITQEMLKKGFLATTSVYVTTEHTAEIVDRYFAAIEPVFRLIGECEHGRSVEALLEGPVCHAGFRRLN